MIFLAYLGFLNKIVKLFWEKRLRASFSLINILLYFEKGLESYIIILEYNHLFVLQCSTSLGTFKGNESL